MTETPQLSGKDLARQALAAYKSSARTAPTNTPAKGRRKRTVRRGDGRDPVSLAAAITGLGADIPMQAGIAGGDLINQWADLCPQYAGCVEPVRCNQTTGQLDLRPATHAYAAQLRILGGQLAKQINDKLGRDVVRTIRVLPVGNLTATPTPGTPPAGTPAQAPVKTRETAHPGYRATLEAVLTNRPEPTTTDPYLAAAIRRQEAALRANRQPENEHADAVWEADRLAAQQVDSAEATRRAAIARARHERSAGTVPRRAFDVA